MDENLRLWNYWRER